MKPTLVIHPVTGQPCYTKHPDKLLARNKVYSVNGVLHGKRWEEKATFWNGDKNPDRMYKPGEVRS